ncbi:type III secretion effector delivery regulator, TyeA family [Shewanella psychrophila]|uniref:Type III secretion effector delivery regulator, TyeA family n=1 Tax=Shewanella psychrophila TaxID=225848 RepID=A0A1S6HKZ3_9GAMM|nr:TyeA family type III secretion system gatekeeper subunit [Shewanella psychrophila]AQS36179.1 type III secretion effector delivery regulator, TyeA family [Shewanella psychrophila]
MVRVDGASSVDFHQAQEPHGSGTQVSPATNVMAMAAAELAEVRAEALEETMEGLSLGLSSHLKKINQGKEPEDLRFAALANLMKQLGDEQSTTVNKLVEQFASLGDGDRILSQLKQSGMDSGSVMLLMMALVMSGKLGQAALKKLKQALKELLAQEGAEIALFAAMEGLPLDHAGLHALTQMYQQAARGNAGLAKWFDMLRHLPERRKKIRVLLRALSDPLNDQTAARNMVKLVAVVEDLRRLLIFLTLEEHCNLLGRATQIDGDEVLNISLQLIEQAWVYPQWLEERICHLPLLPARRLGFLRRWRELVTIVPLDCFRDPEQKEHVEEAMMGLLDKWCDQE